jgi:hypothetical protein
VGKVSFLSIIFVIVLEFLFSGLVFAIIDQNANPVKTPLEEPTVIDKDDREGLYPPEENLVPPAVRGPMAWGRKNF